MKKRLDLPLDQQVSYDPITGRFTRLISRSHSPAGSMADSKLDTHGYRMVRVGGKEYRAHRLAWYLSHGVWPSEDIDHINRDRADNRLPNLRLATRQQNLRNARISSRSSCGSKGVHLSQGRYWSAAIWVDGKKRHLGNFDSQALAAEAYQLAAWMRDPEFFCGG